MGGASASILRHDPAGHAVFEGEVSMERNGGFASVRSSPGQRGMRRAEVCLVEIRGVPKRFKLSLLTDDGFDTLNYQANFAPSETEWQTIHLPILGFRPTFRGREAPGAPQLDPARTSGLRSGRGTVMTKIPKHVNSEHQETGRLLTRGAQERAPSPQSLGDGTRRARLPCCWHRPGSSLRTSSCKR